VNGVQLGAISHEHTIVERLGKVSGDEKCSRKSSHAHSVPRAVEHVNSVPTAVEDSIPKQW